MESYTREEYVYLSRIYERAEKYSDMFKYVINYVKMDPNLNMDERNILSASFKNVISDKRASWRLLNSMEKRKKRKKRKNLKIWHF